MLERGAIILASNAVKTFLVAACMLAIFHALVGRHLSHIAAFARGYSPSAPTELFALDRPLRAGAVDELGDVEEALNRTILAFRQHTSELQDANEAIAENLKTLEQTNLSLLNANREQAEFTYAISHDLKSPSNTMGMLIDYLEEERALGDGERRILADMRATNQRMRQLVDDVLGYSRIVEGKFEVEEVDLTQVIEAVRQDLAADILLAGAEIECAKIPPIPGQAMQLRMLFQNLISNAIKFRARDRVARIEITTEEDDSTVRVTVADNGIGIPAEHYDRIFGLFQRLHTQSEYEGTGLGLTICRRVMANHGGSITIGPGRDGGAAFTMAFRKVLDDKADQARDPD
jgi:light-regulated signal transduction histidine kinase (bacteriophytochrome)